MGKLSATLQSGRKALARIAERRAFESYIRRGRVPAALAAFSEAASDERKFLALCAGLSTKALSNGKATTHYTWRTVGDDKVRDAHAALAGQVFSWSSPPATGHPGTEHNCRCWAEPYFGDPAVPDSLLALTRNRRVVTDPAQSIASIETLARPDGSIAASTIGTVDGTGISAVFQGSSVSHLVSFPDGASYQSLRLGEAREVTVRQDGETRLQVAWLRRALAPNLRPPLPAPLLLPARDPGDPAGPTLVEVTAAPWATMLRGALERYNAAVAAPDAMGVGEGDRSVVAFKIWTGGNNEEVVSLHQETLTQEQVAEVCEFLPDVQAQTNEAATENQPQRATMTPTEWGNLVHWAIYKRINGLKTSFPTAFANVFPEISIDGRRLEIDDPRGPKYGQAGTSRLDVLEKVSATTYCVYDVKTGRSGLTLNRIKEILEKLPVGVLVYIMEVRPFE
ncbi:phage minor head protein [Devosia marina]|uniref:Phage head morphogenesis domain-containing protein n=1 Tax=Devosia marina TaxID=2683198 RepID=A0A7X3FPS0_9HYPH|nr:phage minor head protein [Devosia marina]MVS98529.1 hypothetical protein [Devosia marina]